LHYGNKIFWKKMKKNNNCEFFLKFKINHKIGEKKRKTWCRVFEFKFEYECSKLWVQGGFSSSKCQKGQLYTDFSACLFWPSNFKPSPSLSMK
jgi:hypothetical protein